MLKSPINFDTVRKIGLALPEVEESTMYGSPCLKFRGRVLTGIPVNKAAEPGSLGVAIDFDQRAELLAADPNTYYAPDHYVGYRFVLVRMSRIDVEVLQDLLGMAHRFVASKAPARRRTIRKR